MRLVEIKSMVWRLLAMGADDERICDAGSIDQEQLDRLKAELQEIVGLGQPFAKWLKIGGD